MDERSNRLERTLFLCAAVISTVTGVFAALNGLFEGIKESVGFFQELGLTDWQVVGIGALLLGLGAWAYFRSRRRSVLLRPDALWLKRADPTHLVGREEDTETLVRLCREQPLVFLEGESGAGKSALLQASLVPELADDAALLPVYVESLAGADWEREPRRFLATALWSCLRDQDRTALKLTAAPSPDAISSVVAAIPGRLGRIPLIILDQFDDYQTRHRERFLYRKTWLKPRRLAEQNTFWRDIQNLLEEGTIHLLVVTRADTAGGLSSATPRLRPSSIPSSPLFGARLIRLPSRPWAQGWAPSPYLTGYLETRDSFYLGTANADGQPYIQHRGGPRGFLKVIDARTLAFADFGGNRQFISAGNLSENDKAYIFLMDYPNRRRIKIWGRARVVEDAAALLERLADHAYDGRPERAIVFEIAAWDINCPQHITRRFDEGEVAALFAPLHDRIDELEAEVASLRAKKDAVGLRLASS